MNCKIGNPKYTYDDEVSFVIEDKDNTYTLTGKVYIIDSYGTFEQNDEPSYDVMVNEGEYPIIYPCLFKHIRESQIIR